MDRAPGRSARQHLAHRRGDANGHEPLAPSHVAHPAARGLLRLAGVVDQLGDLDGDGAPNLLEAMVGTSPFDPCATPNASLSSQGPTRIGSSTALVVHAAPCVLTGLAFAGGSVQPGLSFPGIGCRFQLDLASLVGATVTVSGPASLSLSIPNQAGLIGGVFAVQGINAAALAFTNVAALRFF